MTLPIFIDIDGTLTDSGLRDGKPIRSRIKYVQKLIYRGDPIVLWSASGTEYAKEFARTNQLDDALAVIGKPKLFVDDNPVIRPIERMQVITPEAFFDGHGG